MCLSQRLVVLLFVWTKWQSLSLGTVEATEGGEKEGDFQIKAEECAVKNLSDPFGLSSECLAVRREEEGHRDGEEDEGRE